MKCQFKNCKRKTYLYIGECKLCIKQFCTYHYIPEYHECEKFQEFIEKRKEKFKKLIIDQKCIAKKIIQI